MDSNLRKNNIFKPHDSDAVTYQVGSSNSGPGRAENTIGEGILSLQKVKRDRKNIFMTSSRVYKRPNSADHSNIRTYNVYRSHIVREGNLLDCNSY